MADYAGRTKYDEAGRAAAYAARDPRRHAEEWRLVLRVLAGRPWPETVTDVPCGAGRMALEFLRRGSRVRAADLSPAMRVEAKRALETESGFLGVVELDLEAPDPPASLAAELVICFRFLHHLPDAAARGRVLSTLARLARPAALVSFHHPMSLHNVARAARRVLTGRRGDRATITLGRLAREAEGHGLSLVRSAAIAPGLRELWVALFERR